MRLLDLPAAGLVVAAALAGIAWAPRARSKTLIRRLTRLLGQPERRVEFVSARGARSR